MKALVTGGAGFIGSNFVRHLLSERVEIEVVNLDKLTYAGNLANLEDVEADMRYTFIRGDICDAALVDEVMEGIDIVFNLAAESHVDRSIEADTPFVLTNVVGTAVLLSAALRHGVRRFVQVSTDEVYGELPWRAPGQARKTEGRRCSPRTRPSRPGRPIPRPRPRPTTSRWPITPRTPSMSSSPDARTTMAPISIPRS